jgi:hypothetical protein
MKKPILCIAGLPFLPRLGVVAAAAIAWLSLAELGVENPSFNQQLNQVNSLARGGRTSKKELWHENTNPG